MRGHQSEEYRAFMASEEWSRMRQDALKRAGGRCQTCNAAKSLDVHHRTYERFGGRELPGDLTVLCRRCHDKIHYGVVDLDAKAGHPSGKHRPCPRCGKNSTTKPLCKRCRRGRRRRRSRRSSRPPMKRIKAEGLITPKPRPDPSPVEPARLTAEQRASLAHQITERARELESRGRARAADDR